LAGEKVNVKNRGEDGACLCCGEELHRKLSLTSEFISKRAWGGEIEYSYINKCKNCGFAFHSRGLSDEEISKYYLNYRDEQYFTNRNYSEFFYTRKAHEELDDQLGGLTRRSALKHYLDSFRVLSSEAKLDFTILDYGGGTGRLIKDLPGQKYVYDVSGEQPVSSVTGISENQFKSRGFNLVVCAQMLEHATDPILVIQQLFDRVLNGGFLYIEVPYDETWIDYSGDGVIRNSVLSLAKRNRLFNILLDVYGTTFRVKFKILPPFAYVPVREHLQYFTPKSLACLASKIGGKVVDVSRIDDLGTVLLLQK
jgi:SAM-dependent methyltransferase